MYWNFEGGTVGKGKSVQQDWTRWAGYWVFQQLVSWQELCQANGIPSTPNPFPLLSVFSWEKIIMKKLFPPILFASFAITLGSGLTTDVRLSQGMDTMARKLYQELVDLPENLLISPLSIFSAMSLLQMGAPRGSRTQLQLHIATMGRLVTSTTTVNSCITIFSAVVKRTG